MAVAAAPAKMRSVYSPASAATSHTARRFSTKEYASVAA